MVTDAFSGDPMTLAEVHSALAEADMDGLPEWRVSVLRNITVEPIEPYLRLHAYRAGLQARVQFGEFDNIVQEALAPAEDSQLADADCILVFLKLEQLSPALVAGFAALDTEQLLAEKAHIESTVATVLQGLRAQSQTPILFHAFEMPADPAFGALDNSLQQGHTAFVADLNAVLRTQCETHAGCYLVDNQSLAQRIGFDTWYDRRFWSIGRAPYSGVAMNLLAREHAKFFRALTGAQKKCLILDGDNTLWGGIVGEDGLEGIKLGNDHPGSVYKRFQQEVRGLAKRGVILAIASKNNADDVWQVFDEHPDMVLSRDDIAAARINWDDKASNIQSIVQELNIGMNSVVFVDDSSFELNLVKSTLPEIQVLQFPEKNAFTFEGVLTRLGLFDNLAISEEDKNRGEMYKAEQQRKDAATDVVNLDDYYTSLEMVAELRAIDEFALPRATQLTQKTNQFNLTTCRYSEAEVKKFIERDNAAGIYIRVQDRFGDYGIVGIALLEVDGAVASIDTFLLSCRALGRGVEDLLLIESLRYAKSLGAGLVTARFIPTDKNQQTEKFLPGRGFEPLPDASGVEYVYHLEQGIPAQPDTFKEIHSELSESK
jgi:FkbH-like protein